MQNSYMNHTKPTYSPVKSPGNRTGFFNGITSTPLSSSQTTHLKNSLFLRNKLTPMTSPPLYNLSETSNGNNKSSAPIQNISGPLLASTKFNVSLGTYTDTKSPGLANRIVQYSNEAKQMLAPTHQAKYGSPGLFPIVHFFKQDIPTISPKPKKVTVKIASPDVTWYNNTEYNNKKIGNRGANIQNGPGIDQINTDTETHSVLEALKEISRKRIHTTSEFDVEQDVCKRQKRTDKVFINTPESNKRAREEDSSGADLEEKGSGQPVAKKICIVDMLAASYTSSRFYKDKMKKGLKQIPEVNNVEKTESKRQKLLTIGTQTVDSEKEGKNKSVEIQVTDLIESESTDPIPKRSESKLNVKPTEQCGNALVFDEKRLEISRKNRLATLLSALTGEPPQFLQYDKSKSSTESETVATPTTSPAKLVSILSPQNKPKHDKHVTFNLPPEQKDITSTISLNTSTSTVTTISGLLPILSSSETISTPTKDLIVSNVETPKSTLSAPAVVKLNFETNTSNVKAIVKTTFEEAKTSESSLGAIALKPLTTTQSTASTTSNSSLFSFNAPTVMAVTSLTPSNVAPSVQTTLVPTVSKQLASSPSSGGFKFDLGKSPTNTSAVNTSLSTATPKFNFSTSGQTQTSSDSKSISLPGFCMPQSTTVITPTFTFGDNQLKANTTQASNIAIAKTSATSGFGGVVKFGDVTTPSLSITSASSIISMQSSPVPLSQAQQSSATNLFNFANSSSKPPLSSSNVPSAPQTLQPSNTTTFGGFGALPSIAQATQSSTFGGGTSTAAASTFAIGSFPNQPNPNTMTVPTTTNSSFGNFGTPTITSTAVIPSFGKTTSSSMFGNPITSTASFASPGFGTSTTSITTFAPATSTEKMFNPSTTNSGLFVTNPASQSFNATTTTTVASSGMFGTGSEGKPFGFGSNQSGAGTNNTSFSTPNTKPGFNFTGNATPTNTGTSNKPVPSFGSTFSTSANVFGGTTTISIAVADVFKSPSSTNFGNANPQFGSKVENTNFDSKPVDNQSTFGSFNNNFGTTAAGFGGNNNINPNTFAASPGNNNFGAMTNTVGFGTNSNNTFGGNANNAFPVTPSVTGSFTSTQNSFGQTSNANPTTFGPPPNNNNNASFNSASVFGNATANTPNFGFTSGDSSSAFSKPQAAPGGFGSAAAGDTPFQFGGNAPTNQAFGSANATNAAPSGQSNVFAFGNSNQQPAAPTAGIFTFGSNDAKPAFNFNAGSNLPPNFGAGAAGFNPAPAQNVFNPTQYGGSVAGVFSIGSGSASGPRSRSQMKGKKRV